MLLATLKQASCKQHTLDNCERFSPFSLLNAYPCARANCVLSKAPRDSGASGACSHIAKDGDMELVGRALRGQIIAGGTLIGARNRKPKHAPQQESLITLSA